MAENKKLEGVKDIPKATQAEVSIPKGVAKEEEAPKKTETAKEKKNTESGSESKSKNESAKSQKNEPKASTKNTKKKSTTKKSAPKAEFYAVNANAHFKKFPKGFGGNQGEVINFPEFVPGTAVIIYSDGTAERLEQKGTIVGGFENTLKELRKQEKDGK